MSDEDADDLGPATRREPVGAPVVRGDPEITGEHAPAAAQFDPDDPESFERAVETAREFAAATSEPSDQLGMLRGAAACAALVRGAGSYAAAAERAGDPVTATFLRKWARVHDLPISIRRHIARGDIPPTTASHIARVTGQARFLLAWAVIDHDLSVREVADLVSDVQQGTGIEEVLRTSGVDLGSMTIELPVPIYRELRRHASLQNEDPGTLIQRELERLFEGRSSN